MIVTNCDYTAKVPDTLRYHKKSKHQNIMHNCDQCDYTAKIPETLLYLKKSKHQNIMHGRSCETAGLR